MTKLNYNLNEAIVLEIDIDKFDNEILSIWWRAFNTECKIRSRGMSQSTNKTILHMNGVYICIGLWPFDDVKKWWTVLEKERSKRTYIKHERIYDFLRPGETETDQVRRLEIEYHQQYSRKQQAEDVLNVTIQDDLMHNNAKCGMIYQTGGSSHGTLNSPYNPFTNQDMTRLSHLDITDKQPSMIESETVDSVSIDSSLSSLIEEDNTNVPNEQPREKRSLLGEISNFRLSDTITSNIQDSIQDMSKSTADMLRNCERYLKEGIYELPNGAVLYNPEHPNYEDASVSLNALSTVGSSVELPESDDGRNHL
jgi:hypothetical protein